MSHHTTSSAVARTHIDRCFILLETPAHTIPANLEAVLRVKLGRKRHAKRETEFVNMLYRWYLADGVNVRVISLPQLAGYLGISERHAFTVSKALLSLGVLGARTRRSRRAAEYWINWDALSALADELPRLAVTEAKRPELQLICRRAKVPHINSFLCPKKKNTTSQKLEILESPAPGRTAPREDKSTKGHRMKESTREFYNQLTDNQAWKVNGTRDDNRAVYGKVSRLAEKYGDDRLEDRLSWALEQGELWETGDKMYSWLKRGLEQGLGVPTEQWEREQVELKRQQSKAYKPMPANVWDELKRRVDELREKETPAEQQARMNSNTARHEIPEEPEKLKRAPIPADYVAPSRDEQIAKIKRKLGA